jgi:hypothetical protein
MRLGRANSRALARMLRVLGSYNSIPECDVSVKEKNDFLPGGRYYNTRANDGRVREAGWSPILSPKLTFYTLKAFLITFWF